MHSTLKPERKERLLSLLALAVTAAAYLPYVLAARYAIFHSDDYAFCTGTLAEPNGQLLSASLHRAWNSYMTWQGTFVPNLINPLFNPLNWYSYALLRLILIACLAAVFLAALLLCREICLILKMKGKTGIAFACLMLPLLAFADYEDPALWYVGAMAYMVPLLFLILGLASALHAKRTHSAAACCLACLMLFLAGGGTLLNGGLGACLTLTLLAAVLLETRRIDPACLSAFLSVLAGDLVNVLAPGNYVKSSIGGLSSLLLSAKHTAAIVLERVGLFLGRPVFLLALLAALLLGMRAAKKLRPGTLVLVLAALALTPAVTLFPYVLGYRIQSGQEMAGRAFFMTDIALVSCWEAAAFQLGALLKPLLEQKEGPVCRAAAFLAAVLFVLGIPAVKSCTPVLVTENLVNGKIAGYARAWREILEDVKAHPGEIVVVYEQPEFCTGVSPFYLNAAPDNPTNVHVARYFGNRYIVDGWYATTVGLESLKD